MREVHATSCPYCGQAVEVTRGRVRSKFSVSGHTVFVSTEYVGVAGIEHHCDVLRHAMNDVRSGASIGRTEAE